MPKSSFPIPPGPAPITPMVYVKDIVVWQYKLLAVDLMKREAPNEEELNTLGKDGWELVSILGDNPHFYFYFKRAKN